MISYLKIGSFIGVLMLLLTGCGGNSPEIYQRGDSKTCAYDKIEGKSFKYTGESQYTHLYFKYDPNVEFEQNIPSNYDSARLYNFKILQTGIITEENRRNINSFLRYKEVIIGESVYKYDSVYSTKVVTEDCKIYYFGWSALKVGTNIKNSDNSELNEKDLLSIIAEKVLTKLEVESNKIYDKFKNVDTVTTPSLNNMAIRDNFSNKTVDFDKDGFDKNGYDKDGFDKNGYDKEGFDKNGYDNLKQNKKELENKRLKTLINSKPNIDIVVESNLKKQVKDKYESDTEYLNRMKNMNFQTSGIMDINITKEYNPNDKMYKIIFDTKSKPYGVYKVKYGVDTSEYISSPDLTNFGLSYTYNSSKSNEVRMNAYGTKVNVTEYFLKSIDAFPNNFDKIKIVCSDRTFTPSCSTSFPIDKEKAKKLDKEELKLRVNLEFIDIYDVYKNSSASRATLKNPVELISSSYVFKARIKEMIVLNQSTNEILFSYVDLNKN